MNKQQTDQAARDYMEIVFIYKRLGVVQHILSQLAEQDSLNMRGHLLYEYAAAEETRCLEKLQDFWKKQTL